MRFNARLHTSFPSRSTLRQFFRAYLHQSIGLGALALVLGSGGCGGVRYSPNLGAINIASFTATPAIVTAGQSSTLAWTETGAVSLSISDGTSALTSASVTPISASSVSVTPTAATTYTITATDALGNTQTQQATVTPVPLPTVNSFTVNGFAASATPAIIAGSSVTLNWNISNGYAFIAPCQSKSGQCIGNTDGASFQPTGADGNGSYLVNPNPTANTTYTLFAVSPAGLPNPLGLPPGPLTAPCLTSSTSSTGVAPNSLSPPCIFTNSIPTGTFVYSQVSVTVVSVPTVSFSAVPAKIGLNSSSTLSWTVSQPFTSITIADDVDGTVLTETSASGSVQVFPSQVATYTYTLTATNAENGLAATAQSQATVTVSPTASPVISSFTANPASASGVTGTSVTLGWEVLDDATSLSIECSTPGCSINGSAANVQVPVTGTSLQVAPTVSTDYQLTASNSNGTASATVRVPVGEIADLAGNLTYQGYLDGAGTAAYFRLGGGGIALDGSGNLYVADTQNNLIRMIASGGMVSTYAGVPGLQSNPPVSTGNSGTAGYRDGPAIPGTGCYKSATCGEFDGPIGVVYDPTSGNLFVADSGNGTIRMIAPATSQEYAQVTTIAGDWYGSTYFASTELYADGSCSPDLYEQTGNPTGTLFSSPASIAVSLTSTAVDAAGTLYVADNVNNNIRKIANPSTAACNVCTLAGYTNTGFGGEYCYATGPKATIGTLNGPADTPAISGVAVDSSGNVYVGDPTDHIIVKITQDGTQPNGTVSTFAGIASATVGAVDGNRSTATFAGPDGIAAVDNGPNTPVTLYVADDASFAIRRITPATDGSDDILVTTIVGQLGSPKDEGSFTNDSPLPGIIPEPEQLVVDANSCAADPNCGYLFFDANSASSFILSAPY